MTIFDFNMQLGVTLVLSSEAFHYFDVSLKYNTISRKLEGNIQSAKYTLQPWRPEDNNLFDNLKNYYLYILNVLNRREITASGKNICIYWPKKYNF